MRAFAPCVATWEHAQAGVAHTFQEAKKGLPFLLEILGTNLRASLFCAFANSSKAKAFLLGVGNNKYLT